MSVIIEGLTLLENIEGEIECPTCGMSTDEFDSKNYCFNCGQALEWR